MLPRIMATPRAGSTVPITKPAGTFTTKIISEVSVSTLTRMLKARPKNALVSPRVHHGSFNESESDSDSRCELRIAERFMTDPFSHCTGGGLKYCGDRKYGQEGRRIGHPSEDPALGGDHLHSDPLEFGEVGPNTIGEHEHFETAVVRLTHGGVHADLGGHPGDDQRGDSGRGEDFRQAGRVERTLAGLVQHHLTGDRREFVDDVLSVFAPDQDATVRTRVTDP